MHSLCMVIIEYVAIRMYILKEIYLGKLLYNYIYIHVYIYIYMCLVIIQKFKGTMLPIANYLVILC